MQFGHDGKAIMINVVQCQHGGFFHRLYWDHGIIWFIRSTMDREGIVGYLFQYFSLMVHSVGTLEEPFFKGLMKFFHYMIYLVISSIEVVLCVSTL